MKPILPIIFAHCLISLLIYTDSSFAQVQLKPSIGLSSIPADGDSICPVVFNIDTAHCYEMTGLHDGDTIPEFVLYTIKDEKADIAEILKSGKPVMLIGGSYTCPIFRQKCEKINQLQARYGDRINIFIVYTEEAHPKGPGSVPIVVMYGRWMQTSKRIFCTLNQKHMVTASWQQQRCWLPATFTFRCCLMDLAIHGGLRLGWLRTALFLLQQMAFLFTSRDGLTEVVLPCHFT